jgi:hypothetical protein
VNGESIRISHDELIELVDLNIQDRPHWLQAAPALTMKFGLNMAVHDDAVGQTLALDLDRDFGTRN